MNHVSVSIRAFRLDTFHSVLTPSAFLDHPHIDATLAAAVCKIKEWQPTTGCENLEEEEVRRLQKLKSDPFSQQEHDVPASQEQMFAIDPLQLSLE